MTQQTPFLQALLTVVLPHLPLLLVYLVGMILALGTWNTHRLASAMALIGCAVLFIHIITLGTLAAMLPSMLQERGWSNSEITNAFHAINLLRSLISAIGISFLLVAVFARRNEYRTG